jgi:hypothetical protein
MRYADFASSRTLPALSNLSPQARFVVRPQLLIRLQASPHGEGHPSGPSLLWAPYPVWWPMALKAACCTTTVRPLHHAVYQVLLCDR